MALATTVRRTNLIYSLQTAQWSMKTYNAHILVHTYIYKWHSMVGNKNSHKSFELMSSQKGIAGLLRNIIEQI